MNCVEYQRMISRLVDCEVRATASAELFEHLGVCAQCRKFLDTVMKLNAELDTIGIPSEVYEAASGQRPFAVPRASVPRFEHHRSLRSRISTFALLIMVTLFIGLLFSVNINAQKPMEPIPQELAQPR